MDVRVKLEAGSPTTDAPTEILTGLADGCLRTLFHSLSRIHPEFQPLAQEERIAEDALRVFVNGRALRQPSPTDYVLKDGDTVSLYTAFGR